MRKLSLAAFVFAVMLAQVLPSHATTTTATIILPTPLAGTGNSGQIGMFDCLPTDAGCDKGPLAKLARCLYNANPGLAQDSTTGKIGYVISVSGGVPFTLSPVPAGSADFDVTFYKNLPACQTNPTAYPTGTKSTYAKFGNGSEAGTIPAGTTKAIVTLFAPANAKFTFTA